MRLASGLKKNLGGKISEPFDNGNGTFVLEAASTRAGDIRVRRVDSCEIDRLLLAQKITPHQHDTAEHFMSVLFRARMIGGGSSNWERGGCTTPHHTISERQAIAYAEAGKMIGVVKKRGGNHAKNLILAAVLEDRRVTSGRDIAALRRTLAILDDYFAAKLGGGGRQLQQPPLVA